MSSTGAVIGASTYSFFQQFFRTRTRSAISWAVIIAATYIFKRRMQKTDSHLAEIEKEADMFVKGKDNKLKGHIDTAKKTYLLLLKKLQTSSSLKMKV